MIGISVFGADVGYDGSVNVEIGVSVFGALWGFQVVVVVSGQPTMRRWGGIPFMSPERNRYIQRW